MITLDLAKCSGCSRCEVNCSFFHSGKIGRAGARIKVVKVEEIGIDYPLVCQQCSERYCTKCPENAIEVGLLFELREHGYAPDREQFPLSGWAYRRQRVRLDRAIEAEQARLDALRGSTVTGPMANGPSDSEVPPSGAGCR